MDEAFAPEEQNFWTGIFAGALLSGDNPFYLGAETRTAQAAKMADLSLAEVRKRFGQVGTIQPQA